MIKYNVYAPELKVDLVLKTNNSFIVVLNIGHVLELCKDVRAEVVAVVHNPIENIIYVSAIGHLSKEEISKAIKVGWTVE